MKAPEGLGQLVLRPYLDYVHDTGALTGWSGHSAPVSRRAPVHPSGWPREIAPPSRFTISGSRPSRLAYLRIRRLPMAWKVPDHGSRTAAAPVAEWPLASPAGPASPVLAEPSAVDGREELARLKEMTLRVAREVMTEKGREIPFLVGTMIEVPRAAVTAERIACVA